MYLLPTLLREWARCPAQGFGVLEFKGLPQLLHVLTQASPYSTWQGLELPDLFNQPFPAYLCPVRRQGPEATNSQPFLEPLLRPTSKPELRNCSLFTGNTASWAASCRCLPQRPVQPDLGPPRDCPCVFQNVSRSCVPCPFIFRENAVRQPPPLPLPLAI